MNADPAPDVRVQFASVRIITGDLDRLVVFYEQVTGVAADRPDPAFAEFVMPWATLTLGRSRTVPLFAPGTARAADNHSVIIEFQVEDVDAEYAQLKPLIGTWVQEPTTLPWGNRSIPFRDPDGNLVNLYAPVTGEAIARFSGRTPSAL